MSPARVVDPKAVPIIGTDGHLPPLDADRLSAPSVRRRFAATPEFVPELPGDGASFGDRPVTPAAVLVPLVHRPHGLQILLTERTAHLRDHAGQISFPGGRVEPQDADAVAAALREAQEEIGLPAGQVEVLGRLPEYRTVTHFLVSPVVALVHPPLDLQLDGFEVAEAFEVPLAFLMNPAHHQRHHFDFQGRPRQFLSMPWQGPGPDGQVREYFIWGATAAMLRNLYRYLAG